jgi:ubiquinone/menaquinone biosynthesis C-methylase UbiE
MADVTRDFYNLKYKQAALELNSHQLARMRAVLRYVAMRRFTGGIRSLDVGCGTGWLAEQLARYGEVCGLDISEEAVQQARRRVPAGTFTVADFLNEPITWEPFDLVICSEVIEHFVDQAGAVRELARLTKPGGTLILTTPNKDVASPDEFPAALLQPVENWLTRAELIQLLSPYYIVDRDCTAFIDFSEQGRYRIMNSVKLRRILRTFRLESPWEHGWEWTGHGLYRVVLAIRKPG